MVGAVSISSPRTVAARFTIHQSFQTTLKAGYSINLPCSLTSYQRRPPSEMRSLVTVAPVIVAEDDDHAVALANSPEYGLAAAVQTGSLDRGLRLARRLRAGMVRVNDQTVNDATQVRWAALGNLETARALEA